MLVSGAIGDVDDRDDIDDFECSRWPLNAPHSPLLNPNPNPPIFLFLLSFYI